MEDKELMKLLHDEADKINIPEKLKPENIEDLLVGHEVKSVKDKKRRLIWPITSTVVAVAAVACVLIISFSPKNNVVNKQEKITQVAKQELVYKALVAGQTDVEIQEDAMTDAVTDKVSTSTKKDVTGTNVRTEGVDESDIIKTDGNYIYTVNGENSGKIEITKVENGELTKIGTISYALKEEKFVVINELFVENNLLYVIGSAKFDTKDCTRLMVYDVKDPSSPQLLYEKTQDGTFFQSRMTGGYLYMLTQFYCENDINLVGSKDVDKYMPMVNGKMISDDDIYLPKSNKANAQFVVSGIAASSGAIVSSAEMLTNVSDCYMSDSHIFLYDNTYESSDIYSFSYKEGKIKKEASATVNGMIDSSFCLDENENYLRVLTTVSTESTTYNNVYVLDESLKETGNLKYIAEEERIYSARFFGNTGYFVTYRETDPLFAVDFSNPAKPKMLGYVKLPGVSTYLHLWEDGRLLGIGYDENGVKLSMFDISNPTKIKVVSTKILKGKWAEDFSDTYKSVFINHDNNLIGFNAYNSYGDFYLFYQFANNKFTKRFYQVTRSDDLTMYGQCRSIGIDDYIYIVKQNQGISSYNIKTNKCVNKLNF